MTTLEKSENVCWFYGGNQECMHGEMCRFVHLGPVERLKRRMEKRDRQRMKGELRRQAKAKRKMLEKQRLQMTEPIHLPCSNFLHQRCPHDDDCPYPHYRTERPLEWRVKQPSQ